MYYFSRYHLSNILLERVVLTLDKLILGAYRLHLFKKRGWPTLPHSVGQCGPPPFFKKRAPRGPSQNFFLGRLIAMHKCYLTSIVQNFKYKVYEKNLKKCSQMAHITPPPPINFNLILTMAPDRVECRTRACLTGFLQRNQMIAWGKPVLPVFGTLTHVLIHVSVFLQLMTYLKLLEKCAWVKVEVITGKSSVLDLENGIGKWTYTWDLLLGT